MSAQTTLHPPSLKSINIAVQNISSKAVRTPLVKLNCDVETPNIYLKLENLQQIGSFKVRPATNAICCIKDKEMLKNVGVCTASAGNFAQGLAWCCSEMNITCTVVTPDHAPETKLAEIRRWGAEVIKVPYADWWNIIESHICPQAPGAYFIHPGVENAVLAGNATIALEIIEDLPDVDCIIAPYGSGALATGIACGIKALVDDGRKELAKCFVMAVEPETAAPFALSMKRGKQCEFVDWRPSFVDGCGGKRVLDEIWNVAKDVLAGGCCVSLASIADAVKLLAERNNVIAEGAGASSVAAALDGLCGPHVRNIVCVVSGGGIDTDKLITLLKGEIPLCHPTQTFEDKISELCLELPLPPEPKGCYTPAVVIGNTIYLCGHGPVHKDGKSYTKGRVGADLTVEEGKKAARDTGLAALSTLKWKLGSLNKVKRIVKTLGMVNGDPVVMSNLECVHVVNGFSELMVEVFGDEHGVGVRSAVGVAALPMNTPVEVEAVFEIYV